MIGFMGEKVEDGLAEILASIRPGSIVVFGRNINSARQISNLNIGAQKIAMKVSKLPLLIAVDQEGGNVIRIKTAMPLPSALALGETGDAELVQAAGFNTGKLLKTLGFNMNLAPVLDIANPQAKTFIGTRTFGSDPALVTKMGISFASGLHEAGILATAKHFPGHGGTSEDSHIGTPAREMSLQQMKNHDLAPFGGMRRHFEHPWAVMLAHISYPSIDPSGMPATFSKTIVSDLLRKRMKFDGLVLTDDIEMAGAFAIKDANERAIQAIDAGADMIMIAWNKRLQSKVVEALIQAVQRNRLTEARINASVRRILAYKRLYASRIQAPPSMNELKQAVRNPEFQRIAETTVTLKFKRAAEKLDDEFRAMAAENPVFVFSANQRFYKSFKEKIGTRSSRFYQIGSEGTLNIDKVMRSNPTAVGVFYLSGPRAAQVASRISDDVAKRILIISVEAQGILKNASAFRSIADVYFRHPNLGHLTAEHLFSFESFEGRPRRPATNGSMEPGDTTTTQSNKASDPDSGGQ